jgi:hypothetical protein
MAAVRTGLAALLAAVLLAGCGLTTSSGGDHTSTDDGGKAMVLDWDFSKGHTVADAPGFDTDLDAADLRPIERLHFTFPDGSSFSATGDEVRRVTPSRDGATVREVNVISQPRSAADVHALATTWAKQFDIPTANLDRWQADGAPDRPVTATDNSHTLGPGGPVPSIEIDTSFDDDRPWLVVLSFYWRR